MFQACPHPYSPVRGNCALLEFYMNQNCQMWTEGPIAFSPSHQELRPWDRNESLSCHNENIDWIGQKSAQFSCAIGPKAVTPKAWIAVRPRDRFRHAVWGSTGGQLDKSWWWGCRVRRVLPRKMEVSQINGGVWNWGEPQWRVENFGEDGLMSIAIHGEKDYPAKEFACFGQRQDRGANRFSLQGRSKCLQMQHLSDDLMRCWWLDSVILGHWWLDFIPLVLAVLEIISAPW